MDIYTIVYNDYTVADYFHLLTEKEKQLITQFKSDKRVREFVATRVLKTTIFQDNEILYTEEGAPSIANTTTNISISHCANYVVLAVCDTYKIGVDIEPISTKSQKLHTKFLNEQEMHVLDVSDTLLMTRAWSCKEALYKLSSKKGVIFKTDLIIDEFDGESVFNCHIVRNNKKFCVNLVSLILGDYILTINTTALHELT
ncbi:MAG: 4'-phosphopantetheinyl transferase superfamily protein [Crocinitomicaceae bacterium]|nr:4'-phosphopantetheinyl transferase superfamily protein [Crocinitomicaceae bacterium]